MISVKVDLIVGWGKIKGKELTFYRGKERGSLLFHIPLKYKKEHKVVSIDWAENTARSAGKAAAGAIIGGALTGGVGLLAGAALGGKKQDASTAVITFVDEGGEHQVLRVRCDSKKYEGLLELIS